MIENGLARRTPIRIGATSIGQVEVLEGLAEGQEIVISGSDGFDNAETLYLRD